MDIKARIKVQEDTAEIWGVNSVDIDTAFMEKVKIHKDLYEGLKPENAVDLQKGFDGNHLKFTFADSREVKVFKFEVER